MAERMVTLRELAAKLEISTKHAGDLAVRGMPRIRRGGRYVYPLARCRQWLAARRRARATRRLPARAVLEEARLRKTVALARRAERRTHALSDELMLPDHASAFNLAMTRALRRAAAPLPRRWASRLVSLRELRQVDLVLEAFGGAVLAALRDVDAGDDPPVPPQPQELPATLVEARARRCAADAKRIELEHGRDVGELMTRGTWREDLERRYAEVRGRLLNLARYSHQFVGAATRGEAEQQLRTIMAEALAPLEQQPTGELEFAEA